MATSIRYVSRSHYSREASRPDQRQLSASALMDARGIAATVRRGGRLAAVAEVLTAGMEDDIRNVDYGSDDSHYHITVSEANQPIDIYSDGGPDAYALNRRHDGR